MKMALNMLPKEKLLGMLKEHLPTLLAALMDGIRAEAGAPPYMRTGILLFTTQAEAPRTLAQVYTLTPFDKPVELVGTIDLLEAFGKLDLLAMLNSLEK